MTWGCFLQCPCEENANLGNSQFVSPVLSCWFKCFKEHFFIFNSILCYLLQCPTVFYCHLVVKREYGNKKMTRACLSVVKGNLIKYKSNNLRSFYMGDLLTHNYFLLQLTTSYVQYFLLYHSYTFQIFYLYFLQYWFKVKVKTSTMSTFYPDLV